MKAIIYGTGQFYENRKYLLPNDLEIIAFGDSSEKRATSNSGDLFEGKPILTPAELEHQSFDALYICTDYFTSTNIYELLKNYDIPHEKIKFLNRCPGYTDEEWKYEVLRDKTIMSCIGGIKIHERKRTDIDTIAEIFAQHVYSVNLPEGTVVIDMGMNVGIASLFFASKKNVEKVYGFEPFPDTYQMALDNFSLNDDSIRGKLITNNVAVTNKNEQMEVAVETDMPGWRSIFVKNDNASTIKIQCRDASEVVEEIINENPGKKIILKCDTEGSEFSIFESLNKKGLVCKFDTIVMEYHQNPKVILDLLDKNGFRYYQNGTNFIGNITAFKV